MIKKKGYVQIKDWIWDCVEEMLWDYRNQTDRGKDLDDDYIEALVDLGIEDEDALSKDYDPSDDIEDDEDAIIDLLGANFEIEIDLD